MSEGKEIDSTNNAFGKFGKSLENGFSITVEIPPPKGINPKKSLKIAEAVRDKVDGINVTDNQRGMLRMSALAFCRRLIDVGAEPVLQVCCRDRNRLAIQSDLLGAFELGITNICAMTGDFITLGDHPGAKSVYDLDSVQLLQVVTGLSMGVSSSGATIKNHPTFVVGGVMNPFYEPIELEIMKTKKKIKAGASFFQTQPFFDKKSLEGFLEMVKGLDARFLIGITPLKSEKMINFLNENVLTTSVPVEISSRIVQAKNPAVEGLKVAAEFINSIRDMVDGIHIMPIGQIDALPGLLEMVEAGK